MHGRHDEQFGGPAARSNRRRRWLVASLLALCALATQVTIAVAEDWTPPTGVADWKAQAKCAKCQDIQDKINTAWEKRWVLAAQDLAPSKINSELDKDAQAKMKMQKGMALEGLQGAYGDKYKDGKNKEAKDPASKQNIDKTNADVDNKAKKQGQNLKDKAAIDKALKDLSKALADCEKKFEIECAEKKAEDGPVDKGKDEKVPEEKVTKTSYPLPKPFDFENKDCLPKEEFKQKLQQLKILARKQLGSIPESDPAYKAWSDFLQKVNNTIDGLSMKVRDDCPQPGLPGFPPTGGQNVSLGFTTIATDSGRWCTYGDASAAAALILEATDTGEPIDAIPGTPPREGTLTTDQIASPGGPTERVGAPRREDGAQTTTPREPQPPTTVAERPPVDAPKEPPKTPEAPKTPETPQAPPDTPTTVTTDTPPPDRPTDIPDTIFVKATETVLEGQPTGQALQGQVVKLLPPLKPDLPGEGRNRQAQDTGFDKSPAQCTTGADGSCKFDIPRDERAAYRLPASGPKRNYRVDVDTSKTSGAIVETTGRPTSPDIVNGIPIGGDVVANTIRIGNRTFVSLAATAATGVALSLRELFDQPGSKYEEDFCRDKQPGPPLGPEPASFSALPRALPAMSIRLDRVIRSKRTAR